MLMQTCETARLFRIIFVPSCCCLSISFQDTVVDTVKSMCIYIYNLYVSIMSPLSWRCFILGKFMHFTTVFHSINSPDNSQFSHSVLPVLPLPYWSFQLYIFVKVSFRPDRIPSGWLGSKHQLTNLSPLSFFDDWRTLDTKSCQPSIANIDRSDPVLLPSRLTSLGQPEHATPPSSQTSRGSFVFSVFLTDTSFDLASSTPKRTMFAFLASLSICFPAVGSCGRRN